MTDQPDLFEPEPTFWTKMGEWMLGEGPDPREGLDTGQCAT